jgi:hypothetical protein
VTPFGRSLPTLGKASLASSSSAFRKVEDGRSTHALPRPKKLVLVILPELMVPCRPGRWTLRQAPGRLSRRRPSPIWLGLSHLPRRPPHQIFPARLRLAVTFNHGPASGVLLSASTIVRQVVCAGRDEPEQVCRSTRPSDDIPYRIPTPPHPDPEDPPLAPADEPSVRIARGRSGLPIRGPTLHASIPPGATPDDLTQHRTGGLNASLGDDTSSSVFEEARPDLTSSVHDGQHSRRRDPKAAVCNGRVGSVMFNTLAENEPSGKLRSGSDPGSIPSLRLTSATFRTPSSLVSLTAAAFRDEANASLSVVSPL